MYDKDSLRKRFANLVGPFIDFLDRLGMKPTHITLMGPVFTLAACYAYYLGDTIATFVLMTIGKGCDVIDGAFARRTNQVTPLGSFLDSILDRYAEFIIVGTILFVYRENTMLYYFSFLVFLGISQMSYTRALYEKNGFDCPGNPFEYFERGILLVAFFLMGRLDLWLIVVAIGSNYYVFQRLLRFSRLVQEPL